MSVQYLRYALPLPNRLTSHDGETVTVVAANDHHVAS